MIEKAEDFPKKRHQKISDSMALLGLERSAAIALTDLQYANDDFETALGEDWKARLDKERSEDPNDNNSLSNRLLRDHAKTICLGCTYKEHGTWVIDRAADNIEHFGKSGQFENLAALLSLPIRERSVFAMEMGHGIPVVMGCYGFWKVGEEKLKGLAKKIELGADLINSIDSSIENTFESSLARHAARIGVATILTVGALSTAAIFGHTIAAAWALKDSPAGKLAIGAGAAAFALYKEYADPPKDLMRYSKNKKQYEQIVPLSSREEAIYSERRKGIENDSNLNQDKKDAQLIALRGNCGAASIKEVESSLEKFYKSTDAREDMSFAKKMGAKWSMRAMLKYQSFDDLQKLTEDFNKGLSANLPVGLAMEKALSKRESENPLFKQNADARSERLMLNVAKGVVSVGVGFGLGTMLEGKAADLVIEGGMAAIGGVLSQKLPGVGNIAIRLHEKRIEAAKNAPPSPTHAKPAYS